MIRRALLGLILLAAVCPDPSAAQPTTWRVGAEGGPATVAAAIAAAGAGDTIRVAAGVHEERIVVDRPLVLIGEEGAVLDGGGRGHVVLATASVIVRGLTIRGSGIRGDTEDAGIMVQGARAEIVGNRLEDVLYGVYLKDAPGSVVRGNAIVGKPLPPPRRGDGIRLWHSSGSEVADNRVRRTRDVVVYFSDRLVLARNRVTEGRYGFHTMYSNELRIEANRLVDNEVGTFLMYSRDVEVRDNVFAAGHGASGMGLGLKDADRVEVVGNLFVDNVDGVHLDNSPRSVALTNRFEGNVFADNRSGVRLLPSVSGNRFAGNAFVGNDRPVAVSGGTRRGQVRQNDWTGNRWDDYAGFDGDGDGIGDTPYVHVRLADALTSRHPALALFARSPAFLALDALGRFFPLLRPEPVVVDPAPRLDAGPLARWRPDAAAGPGATATGAAVGWGLVGLAALGAVVAAARSRRRSLR